MVDKIEIRFDKKLLKNIDGVFGKYIIKMKMGKQEKY